MQNGSSSVYIQCQAYNAFRVILVFLLDAQRSIALVYAFLHIIPS